MIDIKVGDIGQVTQEVISKGGSESVYEGDKFIGTRSPYLIFKFNAGELFKVIDIKPVEILEERYFNSHNAFEDHKKQRDGMYTFTLQFSDKRILDIESGMDLTKFRLLNETQAQLVRTLGLIDVLEN